MSVAPIDVAVLAAQLLAGARANARDLGAADGYAGKYCREEYFGNDAELGRAYDCGFGAGEREAADEFLDGCDGYTTARFAGVFIRAAAHDGTPEGARAAHEFVQERAS